MPRISCWSFIREEFRLRQLRLLHPDAADFAQSPVSFVKDNFQVPVVRKVDDAIHRITHYPCLTKQTTLSTE